MDVIITQKAGEVSCDFDAVKAELTNQLAEYQGILFTEESKKEAKSVVAELRKGKKAFSDRVKEVKAEYLKPWEEFNSKAKELIEMFDEPINFINGQVEEFEAKRIEEKKELITNLFITAMEAHTDLAGLVVLGRIYNNKWENATTTQATIKKELEESLTKISNEIATIRFMHSEVEEKAVEKYLLNLELTSALAFISTYEENKKIVLERQREAEIERVRADEREKIKAIEEAKTEAIEALVPEDNGEETSLYTYGIRLTKDAKKKLEMYMDSVGIEYAEFI